MGLRFRKSIKLAPGVKLNIGKKSTGVSIGGKYGGMSFNSKTGMRVRASAPGTGLSYSTKVGGKKKTASRRSGRSSAYQNAAKQTPLVKIPVPRRIWYIVLSWLFLISGIFYLTTNISTGLMTAAIGGIMIFFSSRAKKTQEIADVNEAGVSGKIAYPESLPNMQLAYEYHDVKIYIPSGMVSKVDQAKIKKNDVLSLIQEPQNHYDPKAVAVYWNDTKIGYLYRNRLQDMANDYIAQGGTFFVNFDRFSEEEGDEAAYVSMAFYRLSK